MLSLVAGTKIRIVSADGRTELKAVQDIGPLARCYDTYGNTFEISIAKADNQERRVYIMAQGHGEAVVFGETHRILCRQLDEPMWRRREIGLLEGKVFVRMPQKKIYTDKTLFNVMEYDKDGMFLAAETAQQLYPLMEAASTLGIMVERRKTEKRIDVSKSRPVCFPNKVINGNFEVAIEDTLASLATNGVIMPWKLFGDEFVTDTTRTGVIFEGNCVYNDVMLMEPKGLNQPTDVWHVTTVKKEDELKPVELTWFLS